MDLETYVTKAIGEKTNSCYYCFGTGRLKQMESTAQVNGPSVSRFSDNTVPCKHCGGTGQGRNKHGK